MLSKRLITAIERHAAQEYPNECCGLIVRATRQRRYVSCANTHQEPAQHFRLAPEEWTAAEDVGEVLAVVHSHPDAGPHASAQDRQACQESGLPWVIMGWPGGEYTTITPADRPPLIGRPFVHGSWDCYGLVRDWYKQERGIELPDFERADNWWTRGENLYVRHYADAGFYSHADQLQPGDVILMQWRATEINHAGIYLGDGKMLHHMYGQQSGVVPYGGAWRDRTMLTLRYRDGE
ncbi:C40 family peptidase [Enterobacter oligotrophicus]|uniref:C40 family peptidase n=1 Tax=Enterobacter oligotrophicus TaxID=2478464 RepID=UPI0023F22361|nr:C40 family peptidase [Enterobacter oligotrophicus]